MNKVLFFVIFDLANHFLCLGQLKFDQNWVLVPNINISFDVNAIQIDTLSDPDKKYAPGIFCNTMSDSAGNLLFYTGGCQILNTKFTLMTNGDSLNSINSYCIRNNHVFDQCVMMFPFPTGNDLYIVFTLDITDPFPPEDTLHLSAVPQHLFYHIIDMQSDNDLGKVIEKNKVIINDTLAHGYLQATRHANGRDWWVIVPEWNSNCYYSILVSPIGIDSIAKNCIGKNYGDADLSGSVKFSPDGSIFARIRGQSRFEKDLQVFHFDRCQGLFYNPIYLQVPDSIKYFTGLGFSPNNRFLYITSLSSLWQFDLESNDIQNSRLLVGELHPENAGPGKGNLYYQQLGPDGVIYIASPGNHRYLSTINRPNEKGNACLFKAHNILFPDLRSNYRSLPNYPNYRLSAIDETSCDTLGIDNVPIAAFRYEIDSVQPHKFEFINLSYFEPTNYHWDFGNGVESLLENPSYTYYTNGEYNVCLTAQNEYGMDTYCRDISLKTTSIQIGNNNSIIIYPNPTSDELLIEMEESIDFPMILKMYDLSGKEVFNDFIKTSVSKYKLNRLSAGLYFISIVNMRHYDIFTFSLIKS